MGGKEVERRKREKLHSMTSCIQQPLRSWSAREKCVKLFFRSAFRKKMLLIIRIRIASISKLHLPKVILYDQLAVEQYSIAQYSAMCFEWETNNRASADYKIYFLNQRIDSEKRLSTAKKNNFRFSLHYSLSRVRLEVPTIDLLRTLT